ncbi:hypothetical protein H5A34_12540 [Pectobacterium brasiliense]|uniref:DUF5677 domain-containing protein n=1 Tax=Pectobacterium brasiliense TaxID=180957 RepID=UPI001969983D|nr:DUF5677 domain-containing protein [Pectobacterium brasiliense]MBN3069930.1 hypothetical protein [Pectobacterium brasiliense]MBN3246978.1 hypothetical protein [Pectobacterium brasiliense]
MKENTFELKSLIKKADEVIIKIEVNVLEERIKMAISFFKLFIQNNKSIVFLIDGGFHNEALAIHRLSIEHFFNIFALIRNKDYLDKIRTQSSVDLEKAMKSIHVDLEKDNYKNIEKNKSDAFIEAVKASYESPIESLGHNIYNAAKSSEVGNFYNSVYRILSLKYAHSTYLIAIDGCNNKDINSCISNASDFLRITIALFHEKFPELNSK